MRGPQPLQHGVTGEPTAAVGVGCCSTKAQKLEPVYSFCPVNEAEVSEVHVATEQLCTNRQTDDQESDLECCKLAFQY